jgi:hypothetical protein
MGGASNSVGGIGYVVKSHSQLEGSCSSVRGRIAIHGGGWSHPATGLIRAKNIPGCDVHEHT